MSPAVIDRAGLQALIDLLGHRGCQVVGPTLRDGAIVYDRISTLSDLPEGWTDEQDGATYRLRPRGDRALFGFAVGPHSWKKYLFPSRTLLWRGIRTDEGFELEAAAAPSTAYAFLGVRGCELAAIAIQDRVFAAEPYADPTYSSCREQAVVIAVNCGSPAGTCFCVSMGTGPRAGPGFDLSLTELISDERHEFMVETGTPRGIELLAEIPHRPARSDDEDVADAVIELATTRMGRTLDTSGIRDLFYSGYQSPTWDDVASRCLACANCTMVCPTCFCSTVEDTTDLTTSTAERWRTWDSCFSLEFSYLGGGNVRSSTRSRYRQWLTHKLATWIDQFGTSGCVGCGRCITWCPVGIDLTEEVRALRATTISTKEVADVR
jgi:ferredoxin